MPSPKRKKKNAWKIFEPLFMGFKKVNKLNINYLNYLYSLFSWQSFSLSLHAQQRIKMAVMVSVLSFNSWYIFISLMKSNQV